MFMHTFLHILEHRIGFAQQLQAKAKGNQVFINKTIKFSKTKGLMSLIGIWYNYRLRKYVY